MLILFERMRFRNEGHWAKVITTMIIQNSVHHAVGEWNKTSLKRIGPHYRVTSLIRNSAPLGPYSRTLPRALQCPQRGWLFLMNEVSV